MKLLCYISFIEYPIEQDIDFIDCAIDVFKPRYEEFIKNRAEVIIDVISTLITRIDN